MTDKRNPNVTNAFIAWVVAYMEADDIMAQSTDTIYRDMENAWHAGARHAAASIDNLDRMRRKSEAENVDLRKRLRAAEDLIGVAVRRARAERLDNGAE